MKNVCRLSSAPVTFWATYSGAREVEHGGVSNLKLQQTVCSSRTGVKTSKNVWNHDMANVFYFRSNTNLTHHSLVKVPKIDMLLYQSVPVGFSIYLAYINDTYIYLWKFQLSSHSFTCYAPQKWLWSGELSRNASSLEQRHD